VRERGRGGGWGGGGRECARKSAEYVRECLVGWGEEGRRLGEGGAGRERDLQCRAVGLGFHPCFFWRIHPFCTHMRWVPILWKTIRERDGERKHAAFICVLLHSYVF